MAIIPKSRRNITIFYLVIVFAFVASLKLSQESYQLSGIMKSAFSSKGGTSELIILLGAPVFLMFWLYIIFVKKEYLKALLLQIIIFPITFKARAVFAVNAFVDSTGFIQKVSISTFLIIILFIILLSKNKVYRPVNTSWRFFERILLLYALSLTITQLFNHSLFSAVWLSIGGIWQYVFIFYILSSLVRSYDQLLSLLKSMLAFVFVNILMRVFSEQQIFLQELSEDFIRIGGGSMGPAVSYGGYLCIMITIALFLYRSNYKSYYLIFLAILFIELLNTFTRGAFLSLIFLGLLALWKNERKYFLRIFSIAIIIIVATGNIMWQYFSIRGLELNANILEIGNVRIRTDLLYTYFNEYFNLSLIGNGIGKFTLIPNLYNIPIPAHNILVALFDQAGVIVLLLFIVLFLYSISLNIRISRQNYDKHLATLSVFLIIALIQWFFFANTTSTYLNIYYPYEASSIFWIVLFCGPIIQTILTTEDIKSEFLISNKNNELPKTVKENTSRKNQRNDH